MIIEPAIFNHPKFVRLKSQIGTVALECLGRLWAHCQQNKRGPFWPGANADYVEVVCTGRSRRGRVFAALRDCGWIHEKEDGIEIHDWEDHNASLVARWNRRDVKRTRLPVQGSAEASAQTPDRTGQDRTGHDTTGLEMMGPDGESNNDSSSSAPTLEEVVAYFQANGSGYSDEQVRAGFDSLEATKDAGGWWKFGRNPVTNWQSAMSSRLALLFPQKNPAPGVETPGNVPPPPGEGNIDFGAMQV